MARSRTSCPPRYSRPSRISCGRRFYPGLFHEAVTGGAFSVPGGGAGVSCVCHATYLVDSFHWGQLHAFRVRGGPPPCFSARAGAVLVVIHALESPAGRVPRYFYSYGGKMAFSGPQSLRAPFPGVDDVFLARGRRVNSGNWRDVLLFTVGALLLLTSSSRPGITMFWLSGGTNYAWSAAIWLGFLCLYRSLWAGTSRIRDTPFPGSG